VVTGRTVTTAGASPPRGSDRPVRCGGTRGSEAPRGWMGATRAQMGGRSDGWMGSDPTGGWKESRWVDGRSPDGWMGRRSTGGIGGAVSGQRGTRERGSGGPETGPPLTSPAPDGSRSVSVGGRGRVGRHPVRREGVRPVSNAQRTSAATRRTCQLAAAHSEGTVRGSRSGGSERELRRGIRSGRGRPRRDAGRGVHRRP
jgi:hypothetical protein